MKRRVCKWGGWRGAGWLPVLVIALFTQTVAGRAEIMAPPELASSIGDAVLAGDYGRAEARADSFIALYPDEPAGYLFKATVLQFIHIDYEDAARAEEYYGLMDDTARVADAKLATMPDDPWAEYFRYAADVYRGAWASLDGRTLYGLRMGASGARGMEKLAERNPELADALLLAGSYHFWMSVATRPIQWMPGIGDNRARGLEEVRLAIGRGRFSGPLSNTVLLEMLLAWDPGEAVRLGEDLAARYPECRLFGWQLGEAYKKLGNFDGAVAVFTGIAGSMAGDPRDDGSGQLRCWWKLAAMYRDADMPEQARIFARRVVDLAGEYRLEQRQRDRIDAARNILSGEPADADMAAGRDEGRNR